MSYAGTHLPLEVLQGKHLSYDAHVEAVVFHGAVVAPVLPQSRHILQGLIHQQMANVAVEPVDTQVQAVGQEVGFEAKVQPRGGLPLQAGVADILERQSRDVLQEVVGGEIAACGMIVDVVVTADVVACGEA